MTTIVVTSSYISVDSKRYDSLNFEAYCNGDNVGIRNVYDQNLRIIDTQLFSQIRLNGAIHLTAPALVAAFNSLSGAYAKSNYSNHPFSARITANTETRIANYAYPGYVTIKAHGDNAGNVYIGATGLGAGSGQLAPGESVAYESDDLSLLYALNVGAGYVIDVFGAYRL